MSRRPTPNRSRGRTPGCTARVVPVVVVLLGLALVGPVGTGSAAAQEISVTRLQREIADNSARIDELGRAAADAQRRSEGLGTEIASTEVRVYLTTQQQAALREEMRTRAASLYVNGRTGTSPFAGARKFADAAAAAHYGDGATQADRALSLRLADTAAQLDADLATLRDQRARADAERAAALKARTDLEALLGRQRTLLAALDVIPVMGTARLTARQIAGWYATTGMEPRLSGGLTIRDLAEIFLQEGADEGVRGDVAFAQSILETGYFRSALDNNYSGLGACDSCSGEPSFPSPRDGVRAQIQLLKNYGDPDSTTATLRHPPDPTWWGSDPTRAARNFDTFYAKGRAQTWQTMGRGNWATDPNYATKVIGIFVRMSVYAADQG